MKRIKNLFIALLIVYGLFLTVFANVKVNEVAKLQQIVVEVEEAAEQSAFDARGAEASARLAEREALEQRALAEEARDEALEAFKEAQRQLKKCK